MFVQAQELSMVNIFQPSWIPIAAAILIAAGAGGLIFSRRARLQRFPAPELPAQVVADWRFTGKIDFDQRKLGPGGAEVFVLKTEEYRVLESTSGTKRIEVRWRDATLEEAKQVASRHNSRTILMEQDVPSSLRRVSLVPDLSPELDQTESASIAPARNLHH
jgi:hypothetical protein